MTTTLFLYRTTDVDEDGEPLDHGVLRAADETQGLSVLASRLADLRLFSAINPGNTIGVRIHPVADSGREGILECAPGIEPTTINLASPTPGDGSRQHKVAETPPGTSVQTEATARHAKFELLVRTFEDWDLHQQAVAAAVRKCMAATSGERDPEETFAWLRKDFAELRQVLNIFVDDAERIFAGQEQRTELIDA